VKEALLNLVDAIGASRWGQRSLLKLSEVAQSSMGAGNYDEALHRTGELRLIRALSKSLGPLTAIDIGAHHGAWSRAVLSSDPRNRVIAVEPDPRSFLALEAALRTFPNHMAINAGVSDMDGEQTLFVDQGNSQLSTLLPAVLDRIPESTQGTPQSQVTVRVFRLRSILENAKGAGFLTDLQQVNWIKIDTEGLELPIVHQIVRELQIHVPAIQFEFNSHALASGQFIDDFGHALGPDMQLFRLAPRRLIPRSDLSFSAANAAGFSNWVGLSSEITPSVVDFYRRS
jgi:FkbM family methyltransferase